MYITRGTFEVVIAAPEGAGGVGGRTRVPVFRVGVAVVRHTRARIQHQQGGEHSTCQLLDIHTYITYINTLLYGTYTYIHTYILKAPSMYTYLQYLNHNKYIHTHHITSLVV